jgi:4-carboxymuconolactone decarboxylase
MGAMSKEMLDATMGSTASAGGLDAKTRLLVSLAGFVAQGATADTQIKITVNNASTAGATEQEIMETIATMSLLGGMPAMTKAMQLAADALKEKDDTE